MSIKIRGRKFQYRFMIAGIDYSGTYNGCRIPENASPKEIAVLKKQAEKFEAEEVARISRQINELKEVERDIRKNKSVIALIENYKYELTGGNPIRLDEAFELAAQKPSKRVSKSSYAALKKIYWHDFYQYMAQIYPDVTDISHVRRLHCEAYVKYLTDNGRFVKERCYSLKLGNKIRKINYTSHYKISAKTIKEIVVVCRGVFNRLKEDAGLITNPWNDVILPAEDRTSREIYTSAEIEKIAHGISGDPLSMRKVYSGSPDSFDAWCGYARFCRPLFLIGSSGWSEVDICTMTWKDVNWKARLIQSNRSKTGADMILFFTPEIEKLLRSLTQNGEYVFPEHAEIYLRRSGSTSYRVIKFLRGLGVTTSVKVAPDRRKMSVKDHHSLRHSYCTQADRANIPVNVRMKLVGHKTVQMAEHYANHNNLDDLREAAQRMPSILPTGQTDNTQRNQLANLAYTLPPEMIDHILTLANQPKSD